MRARIMAWSGRRGKPGSLVAAAALRGYAGRAAAGRLDDRRGIAGRTLAPEPRRTYVRSMAQRVVCVSRTLAAGGELVGRAVADRLGYRHVDEEIITTAARRAGIDPAELARSEERPHGLRRVLEAIGLAPLSRDPLAVYTRASLGTSYYQTEAASMAVPLDHRELIRRVIREIGAAGQVVITGHAASFALGDAPEVLRVLVTASPEIRARRLVTDCGTADLAKAERSIADSDAARIDYFRRFYGIAVELPTHYDVVVSTDRLTPEQAVAVVLSAAGT
jgi:cytidylate kinase